MFAVSGIATILFLGGWQTGFTPGDLSEMFGTRGSVGWILGNVVNVGVFIAKGWFLVFVMMWVRWTLPRLRIDQVMMTCLKYLLPISCVLLMGVTVWQLVLPPTARQIVPYVITAISVLGILLFAIKVTTTAPPAGMIPPSMEGPMPSMAGPPAAAGGLARG
jgi:NADH-quinone oxidoreductase subunit H